MSGLSSFRRISGSFSQALFLLCVFSGSVSAAEPSATEPSTTEPSVSDAPAAVLEMLGRMQTAVQNLNYQGTLVYLQDGQVQSMRVVHKVDQSGESERLINLNGVAREIVRKNDVVTCYMPDSKAATVGRLQINGNLLSQLAENDFSRLQDYYQFSFEAVERVAGQSAQRILIKPKDASRYGYRLWVDKANAILLRFDLLDEQGEGLEQTMFADISIGGDIPDALLVPESHDDNFTWFKHEQAEQDQKIVESRWSIANLPQGFSITAQLNHQMPDSEGPTEHWVLSDGLASISIYIEQIPNGQPAFEGASAMGATNAFGVLKKGVLKKGESNGSYQITVIGEVPADTVEKLARAVTLKTSLAD